MLRLLQLSASKHCETSNNQREPHIVQCVRSCDKER